MSKPVKIIAIGKVRHPIDMLIDRAGLGCTICGKPFGTCDCWTSCECGWSFEKGTKCRNPKHEIPDTLTEA